MQTPEAALTRLCTPEAEVSAHYLIAEDGRTWQLVDEEMRAWHAGAGQWGAITDMNSRSVGIELANDGASPFPEPQMAALEALLPDIMQRWDIAPERVIGHSDMAVGRKIDPGPRFDWRRLALSGLAVWPETGRPGEFEADARRAGFAWAEGQEEALLNAVRLRLRPWGDGPLSDADRAAIAGLAARYPAAEA
ncbi:N-acetylmuramoyl-L-alanine amidase [Roseivivax halotolerans]|uniref:N-acetylmuramoyl-L-alanine amidase n=1 Tax=Roseivivax halotolerans TaxID=93684 RepID=A0A1I5WKE9_9RHOB|nr:N-acetylmuramoyl-L-alanine amidase [Roseivivax halotolerans]SFQ20061.1 N-acetylmuramoyl-L-alanine amidase [Roseivivax halotolerans]